MATIFTKIQRKVNQGLFDFSKHCLDELPEEKFTIADAVEVLLSPSDYFKFTEDESHLRYAFEGYADDGRIMRVIVFLHQGRVQFKTVFEI